MDRTNLIGYTVSDMERLMSELGEKKFKGRQLFKWLYKSLENDFGQMTDLSKELREKLSRDYSFIGPEIIKISKSTDGLISAA